MHPAQIKAGLEMAGYTQSEVGEQLGLARNTVNTVVAGTGRSRNVEIRIAAILGKALHEIWPEWYTKEGKPIPPRRRRRFIETRQRAAAAASAPKG